MEEKHQGERENFTAKVTHVNNDCLTRQVREGIYIRRSKKQVLNSKSEWFQPPIYQIRHDIENS